MTSRISNDGIHDGIIAPTDIPPVVSEATLSDGTYIALHGSKWDGSDCELLDVVLPSPFCAHLLKSPVFFTGSFIGGLTAALEDLTRRANRATPKAVVAAPNFPVNSNTDPDHIGEKYDLAQEYDQTNEAEDEYLAEVEQMSCEDDNSSNDEDYDEAHADGIAPPDFEFT